MKDKERFENWWREGAAKVICHNAKTQAGADKLKAVCYLAWKAGQRKPDYPPAPSMLDSFLKPSK